MSQTDHLDKDQLYALEKAQAMELLAKKRENLKEVEESKKKRKKSTSETPNVKSAKTITSVQKDTDIKRYDSKKNDSDDDSGSDIEWKRKNVNKSSKKRKRYASSSDEEELGVVEVKGKLLSQCGNFRIFSLLRINNDIFSFI